MPHVALFRQTLLGGIGDIKRRGWRIAIVGAVPNEVAIFQTEVIRDDGVRIGPLMLFDTDRQEVVYETEWISEQEARELARARGWRLRVE